MTDKPNPTGPVSEGVEVPAYRLVVMFDDGEHDPHEAEQCGIFTDLDDVRAYVKKRFDGLHYIAVESEGSDPPAWSVRYPNGNDAGLTLIVWCETLTTRLASPSNSALVEAALIIGGFLDLGQQDALVKRARSWLDANPDVERTALATPPEQDAQNDAVQEAYKRGFADGQAGLEAALALVATPPAPVEGVEQLVERLQRTIDGYAERHEMPGLVRLLRATVTALRATASPSPEESGNG